MHFQIEEQVMRVQDMPLTPEGLLDVNFVRTQPFYNKDFQNSKEKFTVEFWVNLNSQINNLTNQVFLIITISAHIVYPFNYPFFSDTDVASDSWHRRYQ